MPSVTPATGSMESLPPLLPMTTDDFPPLAPPVPVPAAIRIDRLEDQVASLLINVSGLQRMSQRWCLRDLIISAAEIWEWTINKHKAETRYGLHLYDQDSEVQKLVVLTKHDAMTLPKAAVALKMQNWIAEVQHMYQVCIQARNEGAHFSSLKALEDAVESSEDAIRAFPTLRDTHPYQCTTIDHYWRIKQLLPNSFKDA